MAYRRRSPLRARILALLALVALAATYLTPLVNTEWSAWRFDHGHVSLGLPHAHEHPWSVDAADGTTNDGSANGDAEAMVFTANGDSTPGLTAIWRPAPPAAPLAVLLLLVPSAPATLPEPVALVPDAPPPRGVLSHPTI